MKNFSMWNQLFISTNFCKTKPSFKWLWALWPCEYLQTLRQSQINRELGLDVIHLSFFQITTAVSKDASDTAWILCFVCCCLGFWPCAPCFLCSDSHADTTHTCPKCGKFIGKYNAMPRFWKWKLSRLDIVKSFFNYPLNKNKPYDEVLGAAQLIKRVKACKEV